MSGRSWPERGDYGDREFDVTAGPRVDSSEIHGLCFLYSPAPLCLQTGTHVDWIGQVMSWIRNTFEISHTTHKAIVSMEGIRGFAVFLVFLVHYTTLVDPWIKESTTTHVIAEQIRSIGNIGVDLFFVLSGYLIYGMLIRKKKAFGRYLVRRIQRIYPTFTVVFAIYLALSVIFPTESKIHDGPDRFVYVLQNFLLLPGIFDIEAIITVAWSLSYEFFFYLLIPLLISVLGLRSWKWGMRVTLFLAASVILFSYFAVYGGHIRLLMFVSGIVLFEIIENKKVTNVPPVGLPAITLAIASVVLLNAFNAIGWWKYAMLYCLFFIFCLDCFASAGLANRVFSYSPMRWLGNMSYSYYLIHSLALKFFFLVLPILHPPQGSNSWLFWAVLPVSFLFTLVPSSLLFIFVEKPFSLGYKVPRAPVPLSIKTSNNAINPHR